MRRFSQAIVVVSLILFVASCAVKRPYMIDQEPKLKPSEGKALINFVRPSGNAAVQKATIWDRNRLIAVSFGMQGFQYECDPGKHLIISWSAYKSPVEAELLPNRVYYIVLQAKAGFMRPRIHQIPVNPQHSLWEKALKWKRTLPNRTFDERQLEIEEASSKAKIIQYLEYYETEVVGTKHVLYLRPEDGVPME